MCNLFDPNVKDNGKGFFDDDMMSTDDSFGGFEDDNNTIAYNFRGSEPRQKREQVKESGFDIITGKPKGQGGFGSRSQGRERLEKAEELGQEAVEGGSDQGKGHQVQEGDQEDEEGAHTLPGGLLLRNLWRGGGDQDAAVQGERREVLLRAPPPLLL